MANDWKRLLRDSISETFSTMFFLEPVEAQDKQEETSALSALDWVEASVKLSGESEEVLLNFWTHPGLSLEMACNLLGQAPEAVSEEEVLDTCREMVNMVVGGMMAASGTGSEWRMSIPESKALPNNRLSQYLADAGELLFLEMEGQLLISGSRVLSH